MDEIKVGTPLSSNLTRSRAVVSRIVEDPEHGTLVYLKYENLGNQESGIGWEIKALRESWRVVK